jgi:PPOX class probable F420-dependent enzyme
MPEAIPAEFVDLFDKAIVASLVTMMANGQPQVTPVWCDYDGQYICVNTAKGRLKDRNMRRDPRVALMLMDSANAYRYIEVRGRVVDFTENDADQHIDKLAKKYVNEEKYSFKQPGEVRVLYRILPENVNARLLPISPP